MEKLLLRSLPILSLLVLAACSGAQEEDISGIDGYTVITNSFSEYNANKVSGSGTILFNETLSVFSSRSLALKASLDQSIGTSSVSAVFYSANSTIPGNDGITVTFNRSGANVSGQISYNGNSVSINSARMSYYFPTALDLIVEVHNIGSKAQVLVWRRDMTVYGPDTADINTNRAGDTNSALPTQTGSGSYVGLIIQNSTVTAARLGTQKVLD